MGHRTTPDQHRDFYRRHLRGETYQEIADSAGVCKECVRYWCRRQRDGGGPQNTYRREPRGLLSQFHPRVRYCVLRLRLEHPRWGPNRIRAALGKRRSLKGMSLPSDPAIGRYLHQWPRFRRQPRQQISRERPKQPTEVHQRWQIDFKVDLTLNNGTLIHLHTVRDPVGEACIGAYVYAVEKARTKSRKVTIPEVQRTLRSCFAHWGTLPDELQTDGEPALIGQAQDAFPSPFSLWLKGLGMEHLVIRAGKATDNAEVERCHRTIHDYAIVGHEQASLAELQRILDESVHALNYELSSRAEGCQGRPPITAHPELEQPRHPFSPEHELALFDLRRVDAYLASFTWQRKVGAMGQITLGGRHQYYCVGRRYARKEVLVRFDPSDRHFVFFSVDHPDTELSRRPARDMDVADLTGLATWPSNLGPQQLPLPLFITDGVNC